MNSILILFILCVLEIVLSHGAGKRYRNVGAVVLAFVLMAVQAVLDIGISAYMPVFQVIREDIFQVLFAVQALLLIVVKIHARYKDSLVRYGTPVKYTIGWRKDLIAVFYDYDAESPIVYAKGFARILGVGALCCAAALLGVFYWQAGNYNALGNALLVPFSGAGLVSFLVEFGMFAIGDSLWGKLLKQYKSLRGCRSRREMAKVKYASVDDYKYIFMKHFVWEPLSIIRATMFKWKKDTRQSSVHYYNFQDGSRSEFRLEKRQSPYLENYITENNLAINELYVAAYNLLMDDQNVLIKTPSYVEFEPYLAAIIKMKVVQTEKVVLMVSSEEKKQITIDKIHNAFVEYFGFSEIPLIQTIDAYVEEKTSQEKSKQEAMEEEARFSHLKKVMHDELPREGEKVLPVKAPDIIVAAPEDICQPDYVECIRTIIDKLGLIVYYDFSDCVQEEALFGKIVHSVLDYADKTSTLYMSDGFFDLEQVVDNFFSKRNLYEIIVPRTPSVRSYVTAWKAETIAEMQSRTETDASRNIGTHIPIMCDVTAHTENDLMIVEDEYDTYMENRANFSREKISYRFNHHVGWSNILGGNSVACSVSDTYNNVAHAYMAMRGIGSVSEYINIVSRPYLLRNYLAFHLRYFATRPGVLSSYSPGMIKTKRALAYEGVVKAFVSGCSAEQIAEYIAKTALPSAAAPEEMLTTLVACALGDETEAEIAPVITKSVFGRYYLDEATYRKVIEKSGLIEKIEFVINNQTIYRNKKEYSCLIPQQKIVLGGVKYTVERIDGNRVELADTNTREAVCVSRPVRTCRVNILEAETYGKIIQNASSSSLRFRRLICDVEIETLGSVLFKGNYHPFREDAQYDYYAIEDAQHQRKSYKEVNVFCITISNPALKENNATYAHLLALLFNEMLPTFFPRFSERIIVGCNGWNTSQDKEIGFEHTVAQMDIEDSVGNGEDEISLYFLEDSPLETGLVNVFWQDEEFKHMLKILEDYLYYQEMIKRSEHKEIFGARYETELMVLRQILMEVINETFENVYGEVVRYNPIRQSRNTFNTIEINKHFNLTCDFCGKEITDATADVSTYYYYAYSGVVSCRECYSHAVCTDKDSQAQVRHYQDTINAWFWQRYKSTAGDNYYNYLEDVDRIAEIADSELVIQNRVLVTDDNDDIGLQGLAGTTAAKIFSDIEAVANAEKIGVSTQHGIKRSSYCVEDQNEEFILIRDGLAYGEYMSVLCHEMTHRWQYANLSLEKLCTNVPAGIVDEFGKTVNMSVYRIEGHAEWERIRYMKAHGMWFKACKEEARLRVRRDEYGLGFVWMANMMKLGHDDKRIAANRTFAFILKRNFYQFTNNSFALMRLYFGNASASAQKETPTESE